MAAENKFSKLKLLFADSIMTEKVHVIKKNTMIGQVAHLMLRERVSAYPVVDENGSVTGLVTLTDLFALIDEIVNESGAVGSEADLEAKIAEVKNKPVAAIMTKDVLAVSPETPVDEIIRAVVKHNIHTFPVMKDNKLIGIIGRHDLLNEVFVYG